MNIDFLLLIVHLLQYVSLCLQEASPKPSSPDTEWTLLQKPHPEPSPSQSDKPSTEGTSQIYPSVPLEPEAPSGE